MFATSVSLQCPDCQALLQMDDLPEDNEFYVGCPYCGSINLYTRPAGGPRFSLVTPDKRHPPTRRSGKASAPDVKKCEKIVTDNWFRSAVSPMLLQLTAIFRRAEELGCDTCFRAGVYSDSANYVRISLEIVPGSQGDPWLEMASLWQSFACDYPRKQLYDHLSKAYFGVCADARILDWKRRSDMLLYGDNVPKRPLFPVWEDEKQCFAAGYRTAPGFHSAANIVAAARYYWLSNNLGDFCPVITD